MRNRNCRMGIVKFIICLSLLLNISIHSQINNPGAVVIKGYVFDDKTEEKLPRVLLSIDGEEYSIFLL